LQLRVDGCVSTARRLLHQAIQVLEKHPGPGHKRLRLEHPKVVGGGEEQEDDDEDDGDDEDEQQQQQQQQQGRSAAAENVDKQPRSGGWPPRLVD
jgi:hypothetical protein